MKIKGIVLRKQTNASIIQPHTLVNNEGGCVKFSQTISFGFGASEMFVPFGCLFLTFSATM